MTTGRKAIFLDMDATTLDDQCRISEKNLEALKEAISRGHEVVITTGRPFAAAKCLLTDYQLDQIGCRYMIASNGGMILDCRTGEILSQKTISPERMKELIREAKRRDIYIQTYEGEAVLTDRDDENLHYYVGRNGMQKRVVPDLAEALREAPCKALAIDLHDRDRLRAYAEAIKAMYPDHVDAYFSSQYYLEIVPMGVCKGNAVREFCELSGIPPENTVAAGDEENDISMLREAGVGCAVANALDCVKEAADYVAENDNNHSAVDEIVERFLL